MSYSRGRALGGVSWLREPPAPGSHLRKVTACFALSGTVIVPCGAKVAASHAKRKRGGRGVEVRMGEER